MHPTATVSTGVGLFHPPSFSRRADGACRCTTCTMFDGSPALISPMNPEYPPPSVLVHKMYPTITIPTGMGVDHPPLFSRRADGVCGSVRRVHSVHHVRFISGCHFSNESEIPTGMGAGHPVSFSRRADGVCSSVRRVHFVHHVRFISGCHFSNESEIPTGVGVDHPFSSSRRADGVCSSVRRELYRAPF